MDQRKKARYQQAQCAQQHEGTLTDRKVENEMEHGRKKWALKMRLCLLVQAPARQLLKLQPCIHRTHLGSQHGFDGGEILALKFGVR